MNEQKNMMVEDQKRFVLPQMIGMDGGDDDLADDMEGLQLSFPPVSYTHLDVYKRQGIYCTTKLKLCVELDTENWL